MSSDKQRENFSNLISKELPELISNASTTLGNHYTLKFEPYPIILDNVICDDKGTEYVTSRALCSVTDTDTNENITFSVDLLKIPVFSELGFKIKGNYMQMLDTCERTPGWHFTHKADATKDIQLASVNALNHKVFSFTKENDKIFMNFKLTSKAGKVKVSPSVFFRAITGMSNEELITKFGFNNPFVIEAFNGNDKSLQRSGTEHAVTRNDCISILAEAILGPTVANSDNFKDVYLKLREINKQLFNPQYLNFGSYNRERTDYLQSYSYRALGKTLACSISVNGKQYEDGTILTSQILQDIDASEISELKVKLNNKTYVLHRFATLGFRALGYTLADPVEGCNIEVGSVLAANDIQLLNRSSVDSITIIDNFGKKRTMSRLPNTGALTIDEIFSAFDIWVNNLAGYDTYDRIYDQTNRIMVSFSTRIKELVSRYLGYIVRDMTEKLYLANASNTILPIVSDYSPEINLDAFIDQVADMGSGVGQMTDMCNIMSFASKNYKSTSDIKGNVPDELVNVQNLQNGRIDPFDVPESNKIALVHHKTLLANLNKDGYVTTPYLRVVNGEVVDKEPVYLTAIDEEDKYIAEWNETFLDENGNKKTIVRARCNGDIISTRMENVTYKCYSPYQSMSAAHSTIVFPGHSDGKRITMACNQETQALPLVKRNRPRVNAGGESLLDLGIRYGRDVLDDFYFNMTLTYPRLKEYKDTFRQFKLKLTRIFTESGKRTVFYKVLGAAKLFSDLGIEASDTVSTQYPCLTGNSEQGMFTFIINPKDDLVYSADDVLVYSNSCSLDNPEHCDLMDTGAQKIDSSTFNKGLALTQNLNVGYKTFEGSTIDDAIVISDELVYDDSLTSITMQKITEQLYNNDSDCKEEFGIIRSHTYDYFETNGLPKIGTILNPGDPVISKVVENQKGKTKHFKRLKTYQSGQVVYAGFRMKKTGRRDSRVAEVIIAERSTISVGDKLAGRCGNKGVIAKIVPAEQMPYDPTTGFRLQIVLNPLGIPSRQNISQLLEVSLAMCMQMDDKISYVSPYNKGDLDFVREQAESHDVHPKMLVDGRTGKYFTRPINCGVISMYKLHHMARKKIHAIGLNSAVDPVFLQPRKGSKFDGGQSFGEMESWCLEGIGARKVLQSLYTIQSNDVKGNALVRDKLEQGIPIKDTSIGENHNDATMQACFRLLGVEFVTNADEGCYEFIPLKDEIIKSLSAMPITDKMGLHNVYTFGTTDTLEERDKGRYKWSWIDLGTKIIHPTWVEKGQFGHILLVQGTKNALYSLGHTDMLNIINGKLGVNSHVTGLCKVISMESGSKKYDYYENLSVTEKEQIISGMDALVYIFENTNMDIIEQRFHDRLTKAKTEEKRNEMLKRYREVCNFNRSPIQLSDYVISAFPVVPQTYRPEFAGANNLSVPDFDWHYRQILSAVSNVHQNHSISALVELYDKIKLFCGLKTTPSKAESKYQTVLSYFAGKGKDKSHGKIRQNVQSKRIFCSGRATIIPAADVTMTPLEIGIPFTMLVKMYESVLEGYLKVHLGDYFTGISTFKWSRLLFYISLQNRELFERFYSNNCTGSFSLKADDFFEMATNLVKDFFAGVDCASKPVVISGRQPTLHKYSIRAYNPRIVYDNVIHVHTLVCGGYNADFDGDQMWCAAILPEDAKEEAMELMAADKDCINSKNGSLILSHSQDIVLGVYCATMLKDNAEQITFDSIHHYQSIRSLKLDVYTGNLNTYDLVCITHNGKRYLSTAGRLLFNNLVDGFTDKIFTNTLGIPGIKAERYCELKYDGIVTSGKVKSGNLRYFSLGDICKSLYLESQSESIPKYQSITEFGFFFADKFGISLSLDDMCLKSNRDEQLKDANASKIAIEQDFQDGLISAEDRKNAIISLYNDTSDGIYNKVKKDLISNLARDNNLFIMLDSGARGSEEQVMRMCGFLPQLQKDKVETLETPITNNFLEGLSEFDVHMTSFSVRTGLASTQNETPKAGYATHQVVFMTSGVEIVENDCGKKNWWYDIQWGEHLADKDRFMPRKTWFDKNLLGRIIAESDTEAREIFGVDQTGCITENSFSSLSMHDGFHSVTFSDGTYIVASLDDLRGSVLSSTDYKAYKMLYYQLDDNKCITRDCIKSISQNHLHSVETLNGNYKFSYAMSDCSKSLLLHRVAKNLPYMTKVLDSFGHEQEVITKETIQYIEDNSISRVEARILLDCQSVHGICAHCYGLKYSTLKFPNVGDFVGTEAAQAIGEPSAQLTISLVNKGGSAGAAINSGVAKFHALLHGTKNPETSALVAPVSGYVQLRQTDSCFASLAIKPADQHCESCMQCMMESDGKCDPFTTKSDFATCRFDKRIDASLLNVTHNAWVSAGDPLTVQTIMPDDINLVGVQTDNDIQDTSDSEIVLRRRQIVWLTNYFDTFSENNIVINARHFEILARIQNQYAMITQSDSTDFEPGATYELQEIWAYQRAYPMSNISYNMSLSKRDDVVLRTSGPMTALAFEHLASTAASLVNTCYKGSVKHNNALIGSVSIGANLVDNKIKHFRQPLIKKYKPRHTNVQQTNDIIKFNEAVESLSSLDDTNMMSLDINLDDIVTELEAFSDVTVNTSDNTDTIVPEVTTATGRYSSVSMNASDNANTVKSIDAFTDSNSNSEQESDISVSGDFADDFMDDEDDFDDSDVGNSMISWSEDDSDFEDSTPNLPDDSAYNKAERIAAF